MKMREYVDGIQGEGSWDSMHDLIDNMIVPGWSLPMMDVDGVTVAVFPGSDREVTLEAVKNEVRKFRRLMESCEETAT